MSENRNTAGFLVIKLPNPFVISSKSLLSVALFVIEFMLLDIF